MADSIVTPRIFISSTIREFRDLREALKYWLEEMGFEVQLSEHNDFDREPDQGTFQACFDNIRDSNYYILLIGGDKGSMYDEKDNVTVTRQEYRTAWNARESAGKPKIVAAIREQTMTALRERDATGIDDATVSPLLRDAAFTREFIREVRRETEVGKASAGEGQFPPSNWLAEFTTFRELTDLLRATLNIRGALQKTAIVENLRHELRRNLALSLISTSKAMMPLHSMADNARKGISISRDDDLRGATTLDYKQLKALMMYHPTNADSLVLDAVGEAVRSGALLEFDTKSDTFRPSDLLDALYVLRDEVAVFRRRHAGFFKDYGEVAGVWFQVKDSKGSGAVSTLSLISLFALNDSEKNIVTVTLAILRHLYGHTEGIEFRLRPRSPVEGEDEKMQAETVSVDRLEESLRKDNLQLRLGQETDEETRRALAEGEAVVRTKMGDERYEELQERMRRKIGERPPETQEDIAKIVDEAFREVFDAPDEAS